VPQPALALALARGPGLWWRDWWSDGEAGSVGRRKHAVLVLARQEAAAQTGALSNGSRDDERGHHLGE
jgi:hypothetical protein